MSNKRLIDLEDSAALDVNDYVMIYNSEPSPSDGVFTYKKKIADVLALKTISVNGITGNSIVINADQISDTATTKKFTTTSEKNKIALIRTDLGANVFMAGDGSYKAINMTYSGATTIIIASANTSVSGGGNFYVVCNTSSNAIQLDLPSVPNDKQTIRVKDTGNAYNNFITVDGSGKMIENSTIALVNSDYGAIELIYVAAVDKWLVSSFVG